MFKADKMQDKSQGTPIFRMEEPSADDLAAFHRDGYVAFPAVFSDDGLKGFLDEILSREQVIELLKKNDDGLNQLPSPYRLDVRPWNNKGRWSDQLFDAPLVTALLRYCVRRSAKRFTSAIQHCIYPCEAAAAYAFIWITIIGSITTPSTLLKGIRCM